MHQEISSGINNTVKKSVLGLTSYSAVNYISIKGDITEGEASDGNVPSGSVTTSQKGTHITNAMATGALGSKRSLHRRFQLEV